MRKAALLLCMLCALTALTAMAARAEDARVTQQLYEGLYQNFGGGAYDDALPEEALRLLPENAAIKPGELAEAFSLRNIINWLSGGLYQIIRTTLSDFAKVILLVMVFALATALRQGMNTDYAETIVNITAILCISVATYSIMRESMAQCVTAIESSTRLMGVGIPVLLAAGAASGRVLSSMLLPGAISAGMTLFAGINSSFFIPILSVYFALALASAVSGSVSLKSLCKVFKQIMVFRMGFLTTLMAGLLSLQKVVTSASDNIAISAAKFAMGSMIPVVGGILTDALGTVLGCVNVIRSSIGAIGIFALLIILVPIAVRVLLYSQLFKVTAAVSELFGGGSVPEFLSAVSDVWSMLAAMTICQGVYLIAATAVLASG